MYIAVMNATPPNPPTPPLTTSPNSPPPDVYQPTLLLRSRPYLSARQIESLLPKDPTQYKKESTFRLQSASIIIQVGRFVQFPMRTLFTALILYHRFKLHHPLIESSPRNDASDPAIACLFLASKIEDTLQKSRELLAALHAIKNPGGEVVTPDSPLLEAASARVLGLERMLLESACFDFRTRDPAPLVVKFARVLGVRQKTTRLAVEILFDIHRTLCVLKASPQGIALAALLLAERLEGRKTAVGEYGRFETSMAEVGAVMDETLDLWIEPEGETEVGGRWSVEKYVTLRLEIEKGVNGNGVEKERMAEELVKPEGGSVRFILEAEREKAEQAAIERWDGTGG